MAVFCAVCGYGLRGMAFDLHFVQRFSSHTGQNGGFLVSEFPLTFSPVSWIPT